MSFAFHLFPFLFLWLCHYLFFLYILYLNSSPAIKKLINPNSYKFFHIFHVPRHVMFSNSNKTNVHTHTYNLRDRAHNKIQFTLNIFTMLRKNCCQRASEKGRERKTVYWYGYERIMFIYSKLFLFLLSPVSLTLSHTLWFFLPLLLLFFVICLFCNFLSGILSFWYGICRWIIYLFIYGWHWSV